VKRQVDVFRPPASAPGPGTHYELFAGLRSAGVSYLVTGATALTLHGVPRLTPDVDLAVDPDPANVERLERLLAAWGYGEPASEPPAAGGAAVRRFRHPLSALEEIDIVLPPPDEFARLRAGSTTVALVDLGIPLVGAANLRAHKAAAGNDAGREDAEGLEILAAIHAGAAGDDADTRREQIRKFSRWSVAARCDWLLATARLGKGMAPEARPMTRGLVRRRGWYGGRDGR
jgi:hypothetical protein